MQLPWQYAAPAGALLMARWSGDAAGCVGLRPLSGGIGEMRRLYVRAAYRSHGVGRRLVDEVIARAREVGYTQMALTTVPAMVHARRLYTSVGFRPCPPYVEKPSDGVLYMARRL